MPYVTLSQMKAALPPQITSQLLDDRGSGAADALAWAQVVAAVTQEIDGKLGQRYPLPLDPVPDLVGNYAFVLTAELLFQRRNFYDKANPWTERAKGVRHALQAIADGDQPLTATAPAASKPARVISEPAKTVSSAGNLMC